MKTIGYIQQTSNAVELQRRIDALNSAGVPTASILVDMSVDEAIVNLEKGDRLVVYDLSELGDSLSQVFTAIDSTLSCGAIICSLSDDWVNDRVASEDFPYVIKALNALNRDIISKQTKKGLKKAKQQGKKLGRPALSRTASDITPPLAETSNSNTAR